MYDIKMAEKYSENKNKNKRLKALIEKNKKEIRRIPNEGTHRL